MSGAGCIVSPALCVATTVGQSAFGGLFTSLTSWILESVQWFLKAAGAVLTSASGPGTVIRAATPEFNTLRTLSPILLLVCLLVGTIHSVRRGESESLWKLYFFNAPLCVLAIAVARPLARLSLSVVDQLSTASSQGVVAHTAILANDLLHLNINTPGFGLFVLAAGVVIGTLLFWCELIMRTVVLTLLLVLVPVILPFGVLASGRRIVVRLFETFIGVAVSKLLIVITLTLGLGEIISDSTTEVVTGIVTIALATLSPFVLLRLIPFVEQSALHNVEGVRRRFTSAAMGKGAFVGGVVSDALTPEFVPPGPPVKSEDYGLSEWPSDGFREMPEPTGKTYKVPIGEPTLRGGKVHYGKDEGGPYVGWHFDE